MYKTKDYFYCKDCGTSKNIQEDELGDIYCLKCGTMENIKVKPSKIKNFLNKTDCKTVMKYAEKKQELEELNNSKVNYENFRGVEHTISVSDGIRDIKLTNVNDSIKEAILKELKDRIRELELELWDLEKGMLALN